MSDWIIKWINQEYTTPSELVEVVNNLYMQNFLKKSDKGFVFSDNFDKNDDSLIITLATRSDLYPNDSDKFIYNKTNNFSINFYKKYARRSLIRGDFGEVLLVCRRLLNLNPNDSETKNWRSIALDIMKN